MVSFQEESLSKALSFCAKITKDIMRNSIAQLVERQICLKVGGLIPSTVSFLFCRKDERMTISELKRILEDHVMDMELPPINVPAWKNEFKYVSYYKWAVNEYKIFILNYLGHNRAADIRSLIDWTENYIAMMEDMANLNLRADLPFYVATDVGRNILDILQAMN